jgi:hypothetical protein
MDTLVCPAHREHGKVDHLHHLLEEVHPRRKSVRHHHRLKRLHPLGISLHSSCIFFPSIPCCYTDNYIFKSLFHLLVVIIIFYFFTK